MNEYIHILVEMQLKYKLIHWYTSNYMVHLATDKFNDSAGELFDEMVETARSIPGGEKVSAFALEIKTGHDWKVGDLINEVEKDIQVVQTDKARDTTPIIASQLDQLGAYLSVLANNLSMIG